MSLDNPGENDSPAKNGAPVPVNNNSDSEELGPLPPKWEKALTDNGEVYFIDHSSGTSHWLDPRLSKFQKKSLEDCLDDELPYGWEKICDPQYGTYFIDHVNRRTQYENPVIQAKKAAEYNNNKQVKVQFTRNPEELCGQRIQTYLFKSSRGLGFTIIGGDDDIEEFLQIKSIVPNGPAWLDGKLQMGDIIVFVNNICVLGYTHNQIVRLFQSINVGESVCIEVCRGYPLPFDPNDPNTEVVTTIAVNSLQSAQESMLNDPKPSSALPNLALDNLANSPYLSESSMYSHSKPSKGETSILNDEYASDKDTLLLSPVSLSKKVVQVPIVKGDLGFGFTIADSACGQRVKKILDTQRCKHLQQGDILVDINNIHVQTMPHEQVVQVLKNCPFNQEAIICVKRDEFSTKAANLPSSSNLRSKLKNSKLFDKDISNSQFRSKTPTADLYSTQKKEILPSRPKTPLIDTRIDNKLCTSVMGDLSPSSYAKSQYEFSRYISIDTTENHLEHCACFNCKQIKFNDARSVNNLDFSNKNHTLEKVKEMPNNDWPNYPQPDWIETFVTLLRLESGFGFRIVGGTEEGSQVAVGHIVPGGSADLDGRIHSGDEILSIDGVSVVKASHRRAVTLMTSAAVRGKVTLLLRRRVAAPLHILPTYDVVVTRSENEGFGFVIISSSTRVGSTIGRLIEGSPAERCRKLRVGDHIVAVNHIDITSLGHGDIVNLIKESGLSVTLTISPQLSENLHGYA